MDNHMHVGHGAVIGRNCLFASQVGIGGKPLEIAVHRPGEAVEAIDATPSGFRTGQLGDGVLNRNPRDEYTDRSTDIDRSIGWPWRSRSGNIRAPGSWRSAITRSTLRR